MPITPGCSYFLSGVMQGRKADGAGVEGTVPQDYRRELADAILDADSTAVLVEPWDLVGAMCKDLYPEGTPQSEMFKEDAHVRQVPSVPAWSLVSERRSALTNRVAAPPTGVRRVRRGRDQG